MEYAVLCDGKTSSVFSSRMSYLPTAFLFISLLITLLLKHLLGKITHAETARRLASYSIKASEPFDLFLQVEYLNNLLNIVICCITFTGEYHDIRKMCRPTLNNNIYVRNLEIN